MTIKRQAQLGTVIGFILLIGLFFGFDNYLRPPFGGELIKEPIAEELTLKAPKEKVLRSKKLDWIEQVLDERGLPTSEIINHGKIIKYKYVSDVEVPKAEYKGLDEDISKRTENVQFFPKNSKETIANFYSGTPFYKGEKGTDVNKWYRTKVATTSIDVFEEQTKVSFLKRLFGKEVLATDYEGDLGVDGYVYYNTSANWDTTHDATAATHGSHTSASAYLTSIINYGDNTFAIVRGFFPIDTSEIPDDANISAATINLKPQTVAVDDNDDQAYVAIVKTFQANTNDLVFADYEDCGYDTGHEEGGRAKYLAVKGSDDIMLEDMTADIWKAWTLNETGIGWINKTGFTKIGARSGHDIEDIATVKVSTGWNDLRIYFGSSSGNEPYLSVTFGAADTCTPVLDGVWPMDLQDHCTTTVSTYSDYGMECYNQTGGSWVIGANTEVRRGSSTNCLPQIEGTGVFSIQPIH